MTDKIKAFLEADALRTQGELQYEYRMRKDGMYAGEVFDSEGECVATLSWHKVPTGTGYRTDRKENGVFIAAASRIAPDIRNLQTENNRLKELLEIRKVAYDMENKSGKEIERLTEQYEGLLAAFEQVCEALADITEEFRRREERDYPDYYDSSPYKNAIKFLAAAAPHRKQGGV